METVKEHKRRRTSKKQKRIAAENEEDDRLTALLFGNGETPELSHKVPQTIQPAEDSLFEIDRKGDALEVGMKEADSTRGLEIVTDNNAATENDEGPVWKDDDDDIQVHLKNRLAKLRHNRQEGAVTTQQLEGRLRNFYQQALTAQTNWAKLPEENDHAEENAVIDTDEPMLSQGGLKPTILATVRCPDANMSDPNQAAVQAVHFHPGSDPDRPLLLTAGLEKTLRFFQVGEEKSEKIHGIHFPKLPIFSANFLGDTGSVVVTGRRPFFYIYNAVTGNLDHVPRVLGREEKSWEKSVVSPDGSTVALIGNDGYVVLWDVASKQVNKTLKINGSVRAVTFTPDNREVLASGSDGDVYRWDLRNTRRCSERWSNQDGTITSSLSASSRHVAVGAESGVVNLYKSSHLVKSVLNMSTSADLVKFNPDGQILALSTRREKMGLKLLHVPSATVFSNWPTSKTPLNYVWSLDFSPASQFLAIGNDKGKCLLYQLKHYNNEN